MAANIRTKNKEQDFSDLERAATLMLQRQVDDENFPDLYEQFNRNESGSGKYYSEPYKSTFGSMVRFLIRLDPFKLIILIRGKCK